MSETLTYEPTKKEIKSIEDLHNDPTWKKLKEEKKQEGIYNLHKVEWKDAKGISLKNGYPEFLSMVGALSQYSTEELKKQYEALLEILQGEKVPMELKAQAGSKKGTLENELLYRRDPNFKKLRDEWNAITWKRGQETEEWEKHILETEGQEALSNYRLQRRMPDFYTPQELDTYVAYQKAAVDAGILPQSELEDAMKVKELGGFNKYYNQLFIEGDLELKKIYGSMDTPEAKQIVENADNSLRELGYFDEKE